MTGEDATSEPAGRFARSPRAGLMRTRLGAHLAGLIAAAGFALSTDDLARLVGRSHAAVTALLPTADTTELRVDGDGAGRRWWVRDEASIGRIVRALHVGPLPAGAEDDAGFRARALAPFRTALHASAASAHDDWGWENAPDFTLSAAFPRSMHARRDEHRRLIALVTDARRAQVLTARDPDAAAQQAREAAAAIAETARTPADLVALATVLVSAAGWEPAGGTVPRRLAPVFALLGDTERAVALGARVRTDVAIEQAYVARAAARAGDPAARGILDDALARLGDDAPRGALLRTAQAVAGTALHLGADGAGTAVDARGLIERAFTDLDAAPSVENLRGRQFRSSRDEEWALAARTLAVAAVALMQAGRVDAGRRTAGEARAVVDEIGDRVRRAVAEADVAARLSVRTALALSPVAEAALGSVATDAADAALACPDDISGLATVAQLLAAREPSDGDTPEPAAPDLPRARAAADRALALIERSAMIPPTGALRTTVAVTGPTAPAVRAAEAVVAAVAEARHGTALERRTRARGEATVLAEAAVVLDAAGRVEQARAAAHAALEAVGRIPAATRARWYAEVAAVLLGQADTIDDDLFAVAVAAADAERRGSDGPWDAAAPARLVAALLDSEGADHAAEAPGEAPTESASPAESEAPAESASGRPATRHPGTVEGEASGARRASVAGIRATALAALRRGEHARTLTLLADRAVHAGALRAARELAAHALRAAHVVDPVRIERATAAVAEPASSDAAPHGGAGSTGDARLDVSAVAQRWLADGYPIAALGTLAAAAPDAAARIRALIRADLDR
ncbi:hypothetical protein GCM10010462_24590 [Microbacterium dextranolyticum]